MTSAWQNLNGPLDLARMQSERAPELDTRDPVRLADPNVTPVDPGPYSRPELVLRQKLTARIIRQSGFAPAAREYLPLEAASSNAANQPMVPAGGEALGIEFTDQQAAKHILGIQTGQREGEGVVGDTMQRKLPIWAPPHVRVHPCQLSPAYKGTPPGRLMAASHVSAVNGLQSAEEREAVGTEIQPGLTATVPKRRDSMVSSSPWCVGRQAPALRILSPRLGIPLPTLEQRGRL